MTINEIFRKACEPITEVIGFHYNTIPALEANNEIQYPAVVRLLRVTDELTSSDLTDELRTVEDIVIAVKGDTPPAGDCEEALELQALRIFFELMKNLKANGLTFAHPTQLRWLRRATMAQTLILTFTMKINNVSSFNDQCVTFNYE